MNTVHLIGFLRGAVLYYRYPLHHFFTITSVNSLTVPNNLNDSSSQSDRDLMSEKLPPPSPSEDFASSNDAVSSNHPSQVLSSTDADTKGQSEEVENFWQELLYIVIMSVGLAIGIRSFIAEARYIPSESMLPTLQVNDRLIVEKLSYRFREPERGDIVVFRPTDGIKERQPDLKDALIKRIVGIPGDTIELIEGVVHVNGEKLTEYYVYDDVITPSDKHYQWGPEMIPEDSYLVLGDNRLNSYDGVFWGFLPDDKIIGRAAVRIWPLGRIGGIDSEDPIFELDGQ